MHCIFNPTHFDVHNFTCGEKYRTESAPNPGNFFSSHFCFTSFMSAATYFLSAQKWNKALSKQSVSSPRSLPSFPLSSVTVVPLVKEKHWWKKNVKAALAFPPLHMLRAKLIPHSTMSMQASSTHPSPLPSSMLARESRLQRENVINSMERKQGLSIIHVAQCCSLWFPSSALSTEVGLLSASPFLLRLGVASVLYRAAACTHLHTETLPHRGCCERQLAKLNPKGFWRFGNREAGESFAELSRKICTNQQKKAFSRQNLWYNLWQMFTRLITFFDSM